jgi:hypothetical protein
VDIAERSNVYVREDRIVDASTGGWQGRPDTGSGIGSSHVPTLHGELTATQRTLDTSRRVADLNGA